jgi:indole-3-acetate monooxygenase
VVQDGHFMTRLSQLPSATPLDDVLAEVVERRDEFRSKGYVPKDMIARFKEVGVIAPRPRAGSAATPSLRPTSST